MVWDFDPVAFSLFGLGVRWYGISYVVGFFLCLRLGFWFARQLEVEVSRVEFEDFVFWGFVFGVVGGRIGEIVFYRPEILFSDPLEIFKIWHGGMSIHGGILGAVGYGLFFCFRNSTDPWNLFLRLSDSLMIPLALALALGRGANFLNGELWGVVTDQSWGVVFPHVDSLLRHPSQLYEMGKNFLLAGVLFLFFRFGVVKWAGGLFASFLVGYGVLRFFIEFFREPDGILWVFSTGQVLCLIMIGVGSLLLYKKCVHD